MADDFEKQAKEAANLAAIQDKAREFQTMSNQLAEKTYQGIHQGVTITMKGNHDVINVHIDQGFYETSSKGAMEMAFKRCLFNLNQAINTDVERLQKEMQEQLYELQMHGGTYGTD